MKIEIICIIDFTVLFWRAVLSSLFHSEYTILRCFYQNPTHVYIPVHMDAIVSIM
uniref:Uncharacterized protein n=1 Tax=Arundo donax TaxID=35708 RepID=A0A0A9GVY1_ARUDO